MISDGMQLSRALVSVSQKIGTANAAGSSMPQVSFFSNCIFFKD